MTNITNQGFKAVRESFLPEINATLYEMEHIKSGARLIYIDRDDENKTFAIGFATPPENDTGVFHIIEHSVLCGSEKYPLKDPFAELLKGSLNTFLNAVTYEDRTVYPVSSRCEKDLMNLVDVYMDAVLSPNMRTNPSIFKQEGWHYEYDEETDSLSINGVVYNEMKGAYSSPDELGIANLQRILYSDCLYRHDSGGNPDHIPELTYEYFKDAHAKYYHPSGAKIILDGKMDLDKVLGLLDSHLSRYERAETVSLAGASTPKIYPTETVKYEISENESEKGKARVLYGFVYSDYSDSVAHITASILCDLLCGSNASPLKKALLDKGLCKDVSMYSMKSRQQTVVIEVRDADEERLDEIDETINEIIKNLAAEGIDKSKITAALNSIEFKVRERDYGTLPTGIAYAMSIYGSWIYGGAPESPLSYDEKLRAVREKAETDHFEKELLKMTLENPHRATLVMLPDKELGRKMADEEAKRLKGILKNMSDEELQCIKDECAALRLWQQTDESDKLSCIPTLDLSDIPTESYRPSFTESLLDGVKIEKNDYKVNGIVYISLLFDASDLKNEELFTLSLLVSALLNFPTRSYDALTMQNEIKANLGSLFASLAIGDRGGVARPYLKIGASALASKKADLIRLIDEMLSSRIDNPDEISNLIAQFKAHIEDNSVSLGDTFASMRIGASFDEMGSITEYMTGYEAYKIICDIVSDKEAINKLTVDIQSLLHRLATKKRLTVFVTGEADEEFLSSLISIFPEGEAAVKQTTDICSEGSEFIVVPSKVSYAVIGGRSERIKDNMGILRVARSILSYEYLWNTIRVANGAYGTGFFAGINGTLSFYSYRDPNPAKSIELYRLSSAYLRTLVESKEDITKFIIGACGEHDLLYTPRVAATIAVGDYLTDVTPEYHARIKKEMIGTTLQDLETVADIIDEALADERIAIVGSAEHLEAMEIKPKRIIKM